MNLQVIQRPFILPFQDNLVTLPFHGQPQVTAVNGVFGPPDVRHEDEFSGLALHGQDAQAYKELLMKFGKKSTKKR